MSADAQPILCLPAPQWCMQSDCVTVGARSILVPRREAPDDAEHTVRTAFSVWDGAVALIRYLERRDVEQPGWLRGQRVLELGCGSGVVGIAAAMLGAQEVCVTDVKTALPFTQQVIDANVAAHGPLPIVARELDWTAALPAWASPPPDLVLGADIVWVRELVPPLVRTLHALGARAWLALETRSEATEALLWRLLGGQRRRLWTRPPGAGLAHALCVWEWLPG